MRARGARKHHTVREERGVFLRIIAGELGGRRIDVPRGVELRPTYDRVRESLFATIEDILTGARVLDLCSVV